MELVVHGRVLPRGGDLKPWSIPRVGVGVWRVMVSDRETGESVTVGAAAADHRRPALRGIDREGERAQRHRRGEPPPYCRVLPRASDPGLTCRIALIIVTGAPAPE